MRVAAPPLPQAEHKYVLTIDDQTLLALQALAAPYFKRGRRVKLMAKIADILTSKNPGHIIQAVDFTTPMTLMGGMMQVGILCDGKPENSMLIHRARPDGTIYGKPAND